jgi:hypothetical protein
VEVAAQERQAPTTDHFNAEEILSIAFTADGWLFAPRGHTTSEVLLIKNFQARN